MTYNDRTITYTGDLASYDYDSILRDKQRNINSLYELADYFTDADPIFRGIINGVYTPFALSGGFRLVGANEQVKAKYLDYYDRIHLKDACGRSSISISNMGTSTATSWRTATSSRCLCIWCASPT